VIETVAFNALFLAPGESGGTETYLRRLIPALAAERPEVRLVVYTTRRGAPSLGADFPAEVVTLPTDEGRRAHRLWAEQVLLARRARGASVLHSLANTGPVRRTAMPSVLTVLDVNFFTTDALPGLSGAAYRTMVPRAARAADRLIAISAAARDEICAVLELDPAGFDVTPLAAEATPAEPDPSLAARFDGRRLVLNVAAQRPHKNQALLARALDHLPEDVVVAVAGLPETPDPALNRDRVEVLGRVPDAQLEGLWQAAACAAFPTLAEGFGLPVVEAMARGVPVACSDIPVLREVGGDVPVYFDPRDPADAARAILTAMERDGEAGRPQAARFSWAETARRTFDAYERAMSRRGRTPS
jgi:glycosyltransferase involved in cell wall biosynthesis